MKQVHVEHHIAASGYSQCCILYILLYFCFLKHNKIGNKQGYKNNNNHKIIVLTIVNFIHWVLFLSVILYVIVIYTDVNSNHYNTYTVSEW